MSASMNPPAIKILLVDDQVVWRAELRQIIERQNDLEVIAEAPDGEIAVRLAQDTHPDVVVMDVHMPKVNGVEATRRIKADFPDMVVIAFPRRLKRMRCAEPEYRRMF